MKILKYFIVISYWFLICTIDFVYGKKLLKKERTSLAGHIMGIRKVALHGPGRVEGHLTAGLSGDIVGLYKDKKKESLEGNLGGMFSGDIEKKYVSDIEQLPNSSNKNIRERCVKGDGGCYDVSDDKDNGYDKGVRNIFDSSNNNDNGNGSKNIIDKGSGIANSSSKGRNSGNVINVRNGNNSGSKGNSTNGQ
ncbi:hypothetical protein Lser_V15G35410 [Lactuca serriola]